MGNIVEESAFIPPDNQYANDRLKEDHKEHLQLIENSMGNKVAVLWFDFGAEFTILYSHGNAEDLAGSKDNFMDLAAYLECNFCAYDYSGYGLSEGKCSEKACFADIECVYHFLTAQQSISSKKIIAFGRSLGSGPTIHLAASKRDLAGMVLQSPLRTAIKTQMPDWVGFVLTKMDIFKNEDKVPLIRTFPVLIVHGVEDQVVPYSHGQHLYNLLRAANDIEERVQMYSVPGCGHNDIEYRRGREFKRKLKQFVAEEIKTKRQRNAKKAKSKKKKSAFSASCGSKASF